MKRNMLALVALLICVGAQAQAQETVLPSTKLMRQQSQFLYRDLGSMMKGEAPFSADVARRAVNGLLETSHNLVDAFPANQKGRMTPDSRYSASPKVWETRSDFEAKTAMLVNELKATEASFQTLDGLKAAYPRVNEACNGCHKDYRERR